MKFAATHLREYPASKVCRILKIPKSSYYAGRRKVADKKGYSREENKAVCEMFIKHHGSFGRRILKKELEKAGISMSERKISRIMKNLELCSKYGRKKGKNVHTSKNTQKYIQENLYARLSREEKEKMEIWSMDFTEEKIGKTKIYTCGIISVNSRIIVGYSQGKKCTSELAIEALEKAIYEYGVPDMITTDRGPQFTSESFYDILHSLNILHSMSRPHRPVDNRFIETFWKSFKIEIGKLVLLTEQTYRMVVDYYIYYYNNIRPHSSLNYLPPLSA